MKKVWLNILFILVLSATSGAQQKYWIYFKDKKNITIPAGNDFYDLAIASDYLDALKQLNCEIIQRSKWLNAVTIRLTEQQLTEINHLDFVKKIIPVNLNLKIASLHSKDYDTNLALKQIHADTLISLGLRGRGVKVGLIDGGFMEANTDDRLKSIISNHRLIAYKNFIEKDIQNPFIGIKKNDDDHGTTVWALTGGYNEASNKYYGLASESDYYLARTDQGDKEYRGEEDYWIAALEWMYDQGVRLINSSLGYSNGYDNPKENYSPNDVDGQSSAITQAAAIAAKEKGMILVISAGNDGGNYFEVISIPADAEGILAVGATGYNLWKKQFYSSTGPSGLSYVKPDVSCYSSHGTSFSAPIITGLVASLLQAAPDLSGPEVVAFIKQSSHLYHYPNNFIGYGVPDARKLLRLLNDESDINSATSVRATSNTIDLLLDHDNIVLFHKRDKTQVIHQEDIKPKRNKISVIRYENASFTTVATPEKVIEIIWP